MADELQIRLTARDEIGGKLKDTRAEIKKTVADLTRLSKEMDKPGGAKAYDDARRALSELSQEERRLRTEMGRNERALREYGAEGQKSAAKVAAGQEKVRKSFLKSRTAAVGFGVGAGLALSRVMSGAKSVVAGFDTVGSATAKLQRVMGGTTEDASRLAHAFAMTGIDGSKAQTSLTRFSKNLAAGSKDFKTLGIQTTDASGKLLTSQQVLANTADAFAKMPDGAAKTAAAMKLFGKAGTDMLPFLNRGKKGLADLFAESDKVGTTLSGKDLDAVKANTKAKRLWSEAVKGVQVALGRELYPALTSGAKFLSGTVAPGLKSVIAFVKQWRVVIIAVGAAAVAGVVSIKAIEAATRAWTAASKAAGVAQSVWAAKGKVLAAAQKVWTAVQWAWNAAMAANPIVLVVAAVVGLIAIFVLAYRKVGWFRDAVNTAWAWIKRATKSFVNWLKGTAWPAIRGVLSRLGDLFKAAWRIAKQVWAGIKSAVGSFVSWFRASAWPAIKRVAGYIAGYYKTLWKAIKVVWSGIKAAVSGYVSYFKATALPAIKVAINLVKGYFQAVWRVAKTVWKGVSGAVSTAVRAIKDTISGVKGVFSKVWDGVSGAAKRAFSGIKRAWNSTVGSFGFTVPDWVPKLGGKSWHMPRMQDGGLTWPGLRALVGEVGPELFVPSVGRPRVIGADGPEVIDFRASGVVIPNHMMPAMPANIVVRERERVLVGAGGPQVHVDTINATSNVDVEAALLHAQMRADRIRNERRAVAR